MKIRWDLSPIFAISLFVFTIVASYAENNSENKFNAVKETNFLDLPQPFYFIAEGISVEEVIQGFSNNYRVKVSVSEKIDINVNKSFEAFSARNFLDEFCVLYNLTWYFDGNVLYITSISENTSVMLTLSNITVAQLKEAAKETGIWDERFKWKEIPEQSIVYLSGPPRYVALIQETLKIVDSQRARLEEKNLKVSIIKLKHIAVSDEVVQLLQKMFIDNKSVLYAGDSDEKGKETSSIVNPKKKKLSQIFDIAAANQPPVNSGIEAIVQLNAILVRDTPQRIDIYKYLINELDKPQRQIEISLSIIDILVSKSEDLGVLWDLAKGFDKDSNLGITLNSDLSSKALTGGNPFTLVGKETSDFISRISVLHREGNAKYASRPAVLTQDNTTANLDFNNIIYIPLSSRYSSSIQEIQYGTSLKITPRIIDFGNKKKVSLKIQIQDGKQSTGEKQTELPMINNVTINTMATINEGESLLIGGYYTDSTIDKVNKLPILGDLPIIGLLFKDRSNKKVKFMRMFLLQPRIVYSTTDKSNPLYDERDRLLEKVDKANETSPLTVSKEDLAIWGTSASTPKEEKQKSGTASVSLKEQKTSTKAVVKQLMTNKALSKSSHKNSITVVPSSTAKSQQWQKTNIKEPAKQLKVNKETDERTSKDHTLEVSEKLNDQQLVNKANIYPSFTSQPRTKGDECNMPNDNEDLNRLQNKYIYFKSVFPCYTKDKAKLMIEKNKKANIEYSEIDCLTEDGILGVRIVIDN